MPDKDNNKHQTIGQVLITTHVKKNPVVTFAAGEHHSVPYNDKHDNRRQTMAQTTSKHTHTTMQPQRHICATIHKDKHYNRLQAMSNEMQ